MRGKSRGGNTEGLPGDPRARGVIPTLHRSTSLVSVLHCTTVVAV